MKYAKEYKVYADQIYLGDIVQSETTFPFNVRLTTNKSCYLIMSQHKTFATALDSLLDSTPYNIDNTFEIRLVPVLN